MKETQRSIDFFGHPGPDPGSRLDPGSCAGVTLASIRLYLCLIACSLFLSSTSLHAEAEEKEKYGFGAAPIIGYASGFGTGFGAVGSFYKKEPKLSPYKYELDAQAYFMTGGLQSHRIRFDYLQVGGLPLRLRAMTGMLANFAENYCGPGTLANCTAGMPTNFYLTRYLEAYGTIEGRWALKPMPHRTEIIWSWRGSYYRIGDWSQAGPYPGSLYAQEPQIVGDGGGFASVLEAGLMFDDRDFEPAPTKGYWIETTLRESSPFWGSSWSYLGANLSLRGYLPLIPSRHLVLAAQVIFDGMAGDKAPLQEIVRIGGTGRYFNTFGGELVGRGLREQYFPGRLKAYKQVELRYDFFDFDVWKWNFDLTAAAFADMGLVAWNYSTLSEESFRPSIGFGGGLRVLWDRTLVVRFDVGTSPIESYSPRFYFVIGNAF